MVLQVHEIKCVWKTPFCKSGHIFPTNKYTIIFRISNRIGTTPLCGIYCFNIVHYSSLFLIDLLWPIWNFQFFVLVFIYRPQLKYSNRTYTALKIVISNLIMVCMEVCKSRLRWDHNNANSWHQETPKEIMQLWAKCNEEIYHPFSQAS